MWSEEDLRRHAQKCGYKIERNGIKINNGERKQCYLIIDDTPREDFFFSGVMLQCEAFIRGWNRGNLSAS